MFRIGTYHLSSLIRIDVSRSGVWYIIISDLAFCGTVWLRSSFVRLIMASMRCYTVFRGFNLKICQFGELIVHSPISSNSFFLFFSPKFLIHPEPRDFSDFPKRIPGVSFKSGRLANLRCWLSWPVSPLRRGAAMRTAPGGLGHRVETLRKHGCLLENMV